MLLLASFTSCFLFFLLLFPYHKIHEDEIKLFLLHRLNNFLRKKETVSAYENLLYSSFSLYLSVCNKVRILNSEAFEHLVQDSLIHNVIVCNQNPKRGKVLRKGALRQKRKRRKETRREDKGVAFL